MPSVSSASKAKATNGGAAKEVRLSSSSSSSSSSKASKSRSKNHGGRQLTSIQERVWQTVKNASASTMTLEQLQVTLNDIDVHELSSSYNKLLSKSLLRMERTADGGPQFVALSKGEASTMGKLEPDEGLIFSHIRESKDEGIWTLQLKKKINVHQTVLNRCLKSLEGKGLIKAVKSVKFPTRKIYMLAHLVPSVELSGGPWYTDNELDVVFIEQLSDLLLQFITKKTWPEASLPGKSNSEARRPLYLASHTQKLPSTQTCWEWLSSTKLSNTQLTLKDVQDLLDVLVYDGKIEKIPFIRVGELHDEADYKPSKNRKQHSKRSDSESDENDDDESETEGDDSARSDSESHSDDSGQSRRSRKRKRSSAERHKSSKRSYSHTSNSRSSNKRGSGSKDQRDRRKNNTKSRSIRLSDYDSESEEDSDVVDDDDEEEDGEAKASSGVVSGHVYRAIRRLHMDTGWIEVPCAHCPVFDFCHPGGPVNGEACLYLRDWMKDSLASHAKKAEEDEREQANGFDNAHASDVTIAYEGDEGEVTIEQLGEDESVYGEEV